MKKLTNLTHRDWIVVLLISLTAFFLWMIIRQWTVYELKEELKTKNKLIEKSWLDIVSDYLLFSKQARQQQVEFNNRWKQRIWTWISLMDWVMIYGQWLTNKGAEEIVLDIKQK